jgi:hypothetical protein
MLQGRTIRAAGILVAMIALGSLWWARPRRWW